MRAFAATAVLGLCLTGWAAADPGGPGWPAAHVDRLPRPVVRMSGSVTRLYPGIPKSLPITFRNRGKHRVVLRHLKARVLRGRPGCKPRELTIGRLPKRVKVGARRRKKVKVSVTLRASAPNACQNARFTVRVRAQVRRS